MVRCISSAPPVVMSTRCHQLAMMVVYESAFQVLCDSPHNYRMSPQGLDFLKIVPTSWEETRVLNEQIGDYITVARKSGEDWFVGTLNDGDPRELDISLDFLPDGSFRAHLWMDGPDASKKPASVESVLLDVTASDSIAVNLASGGGHVIHLEALDDK